MLIKLSGMYKETRTTKKHPPLEQLLRKTFSHVSHPYTFSVLHFHTLQSLILNLGLERERVWSKPCRFSVLFSVQWIMLKFCLFSSHGYPVNRDPDARVPYSFHSHTEGLHHASTFLVNGNEDWICPWNVDMLDFLLKQQIFWLLLSLR